MIVLRIFQATLQAITAIFITDNAISITDNAISITDNEIFITDNVIFITDNVIYITDNEIYITDNANFITDNAIFITDNAIFITDNAIFITDNAIFITDNAIFITDNAIYLLWKESLTCKITIERGNDVSLITCEVLIKIASQRLKPLPLLCVTSDFFVNAPILLYDLLSIIIKSYFVHCHVSDFYTCTYCQR